MATTTTLSAEIARLRALETNTDPSCVAGVNRLRAALERARRQVADGQPFSFGLVQNDCRAAAECVFQTVLERQYGQWVDAGYPEALSVTEKAVRFVIGYDCSRDNRLRECEDALRENGDMKLLRLMGMLE